MKSKKCCSTTLKFIKMKKSDHKAGFSRLSCSFSTIHAEQQFVVVFGVLDLLQEEIHLTDSIIFYLQEY